MNYTNSNKHYYRRRNFEIPSGPSSYSQSQLYNILGEVLSWRLPKGGINVYQQLL
jgi:hypothetical protein